MILPLPLIFTKTPMLKSPSKTPHYACVEINLASPTAVAQPPPRLPSLPIDGILIPPLPTLLPQLRLTPQGRTTSTTHPRVLKSCNSSLPTAVVAPIPLYKNSPYCNTLKPSLHCRNLPPNVLEVTNSHSMPITVQVWQDLVVSNNTYGTSPLTLLQIPHQVSALIP